MRISGIVLAIAATASLPALAAKPVTLEQLQQALAEAQAVHLSDSDTARKLADVDLTVQLRPAALQHLLIASPGPRTSQALRGISDASLFLDPPASEVPSTPAPDFATQKAIMARTIHYVARTLPTIPDFMASRITEHFDDAPQALQPNGWPVRAGLHLDGSFEAPISFMDGGERSAPVPAPAPELKKASSAKAAASARAAQAASGMNSWGEFRTILGIVLVDAAKGKVEWARWERIDGQPAAVFQFQVERPASHYDVQFARNRPSKGAVKPVSNYVFHQTSGYHGHIAVDPSTGAVLRVVIDADLEPGSPIHRASVLVEYAPVKIGSRSYICPVRSIALTASDEVFQPTSLSPFEDLVELQVNETSFSGYRRFGSDATVLNEAHGNETALTAAAPTLPSGTTASTPAENPAAAGTELATAGAPPADVVAEAAPATGESISAEVAKEDQEILIEAVDSMPGETEDATAGDETAGNNQSTSSLTLKSTARLVDVGLLAYDKHGKPITDLKQEDIEIYDNGRRQQLHTFHQTTPSAASQPAQTTQPSLPPDTFTNATIVKREIQDAPDLLILLLDESHLAYLDLNRARGELLRFLQATRPTSRIAVYSINEHGFRVLQEVTQDHALVMQKLTSWMPSAASISQAQDLDRRIHQQFDTVHNIEDLGSVNGNYADNPDGMHTIDPELNLMGQNPLRETLGGMIALSRHFSSVPGHKSMAWIAGDSVLADWTDQAVGIQKGSKQLNAALERTKEALNDAHIALYAVDASAVSGDGVDPSLQNRNIQLNQAAADNAALYAPPVPRNSVNGRTTGQMEQDLHGIQGPVRQLAESTGGRAINKGGDLKAIMDSIDEDSNSLYELGFDPDTPADGKFHTLLLKIPSRKDVKLRYRTGYLYEEESATTKQRFQQAIWSPQDAGDLALTAEAVPAAGATSESSVKLKINFAGLALQQKQGQRPDRWTDQLYIFVAVRDDATQKAEVSGDTLRLSLKQATYESGMPEGVPYQRAVEVKSRLGSVRVIVVDGNSGKMGSVTLPSSALHP
jgi:VWFA-related protein